MRVKALAASVVAASLLLMAPAEATVRQVDYVVDGDTVRLSNGTYVRLIGIDTPEVGQCGYRAAKRHLDRWVNGSVRLVNPDSVDDRDHYDRLLPTPHYHRLARLWDRPSPSVACPPLQLVRRSWINRVSDETVPDHVPRLPARDSPGRDSPRSVPARSLPPPPRTVRPHWH